jgi:predicted transcriptional regulator
MKGTFMGRKKLDRSDKVIQTFESTKPLKIRLEETAQKRNITTSALIREILEQFFEDRQF